MTHLFASLAWLVLPPLSAVAAALLWHRIRLWGLIPITLALVLLTGSILYSSYSKPADPFERAEEETLVEAQLKWQAAIGLIFFVGCSGVIWQCSRDIWRQKKEPIQPPETTRGK